MLNRLYANDDQSAALPARLQPQPRPAQNMCRWPAPRPATQRARGARGRRGAPLVVERAVAHVRDVVGGQLEGGGDVARDLQHGALLLRADVVRLAHAPLGQDGLERGRHVLHEQVAARRLRARARA
jgi:hypothetical protein